MRGLQRLLLGSGKGPFYPHGESESWGQSRVGNQSTFLQEERVRGRPSARGTGGGLGACLPSTSAPVDEIWLSTRLTVPISLQNLPLGLERNAYSILLAEPLTHLRFSPPRHVFQPPPSCSPVPDSKLDVAGEAGQLQGEARETQWVCVPAWKVQSSQRPQALGSPVSRSKAWLSYQ